MTPGGSRPEGCRFADGDGRACIPLNGLQRVRPDQHARHKPVDPDGPVTEVLTVVSLPSGKCCTIITGSRSAPGRAKFHKIRLTTPRRDQRVKRLSVGGCPSKPRPGGDPVQECHGSYDQAQS